MSFSNVSHIIAKESQDLFMESDEAVINLFELQFNAQTFRFHAENSSENIQFGGNTYSAFPMEVTGIETTSEGAQNRPTLSIANVNSLLRSDSEIPLNNAEDILGSRLTVRTTLSKYITLGSVSSPANAYEFKKSTYIVDRLTSKSQLVLVFELASPFDLAGARIPSRQVTGKYCPWYYKGYVDGNVNTRSACDWESLAEENEIATVSHTQAVRGMSTTSGTMGLSWKAAFDGVGTNSDGTPEQLDASKHFNLNAGQNLVNQIITDPDESKPDPAKFKISLSSGNTATGSNNPNGYAITSLTVEHPGAGYKEGDLITLPSNLWDNGGRAENLSFLRLSVLTVSAINAEIYFSIDDEPFIPSSYLTSGTYTNHSLHNPNTKWPVGTIVEEGSSGTFYIAKNGVKNEATGIFEVPTGVPLNEVSIYWKKVRVFSIWNTDTTGSTSYTVDSEDSRKSSYVYYPFNDATVGRVRGNIWRVIRAHTKSANNAPGSNSLFWTSADVCGKLLSSCKARYQSKLLGNTTIVTDTSTSPNTSVKFGWGTPAMFDTKIGLPFGGFPGTRKFR